MNPTTWEKRPTEKGAEIITLNIQHPRLLQTNLLFAF